MDPLPGEEHLAGLTVLQYALLTPQQRRPPIGPICFCPVPDPHRLGGQRPMLRWAEHDRLTAACGTCLKPIKQGIHKRRSAVHVLGLAELPIDALDLADLADAGLLLDHPPRPAPPEADAFDPEAPSWPGRTELRLARSLDSEELAHRMDELLAEASQLGWRAFAGKHHLPGAALLSLPANSPRLGRSGTTPREHERPQYLFDPLLWSHSALAGLSLEVGCKLIPQHNPPCERVCLL